MFFCEIASRIKYFTELFCLNEAQDRMNGAPKETHEANLKKTWMCLARNFKVACKGEGSLSKHCNRNDKKSDMHVALC